MSPRLRVVLAAAAAAMLVPGFGMTAAYAAAPGNDTPRGSNGDHRAAHDDRRVGSTPGRRLLSAKGRPRGHGRVLPAQPILPTSVTRPT